MTFDEYVEKIERLEVKAGEMLLVTVHQPVTPSVVGVLRMHLLAAMPDGVTCVVVAADVEMRIVAKAGPTFPFPRELLEDPVATWWPRRFARWARREAALIWLNLRAWYHS